jgi:hypothetical protein
VCTYAEVRTRCGTVKRGPCFTKDKCRRRGARIVCVEGELKPIGTRCGGIFSKRTCQADGSCTR